MTSPDNQVFVDSLGCYHRCLAYTEITSLCKDKRTLYLDFSGSEVLRAKVHHHFGDLLVYVCFAGSARNTEFLRDIDLPGLKPQLYFAPVQIRKRNADWGA